MSPVWTAERYLQRPESLETWEQVRSAILHLAKEPDPCLWLTEDTGAFFTVGVKVDRAFVLHDPSPPTLTTSASLNPGFKRRTDADYVEFMVGGTRTPILKDRCIPLQTVLLILEEYWRDGRLSRLVSWVRG